MKTQIENIFLFLLIAVLFSLCKKKTPEDIGLPLLPGEDLLNAQFSDTLTLVSHTVKDDSLNTKNVTSMLLGNLNDPIFGITSASVFTQFEIPSGKTNPNFGANPVLDSAVLSLVFTSVDGKGQYYGKPTPQKFDVYELSQKIHKDSVYYSNRKVEYYTTQTIGSAVIIPNRDSIKLQKQPPQIRIKLSKEMFQNFLEPSYVSSYNSTANFQEKFKGIYIKSSTMPSSGEGAILYLNLANTFTRITLYYNDTLTYHFGVASNSQRYSYFEHDYSSAIMEINAQLNSPDTIQADKVFVQPMAGLRTKITMPHLPDFFKNGKVAINKAELILPVDPSSVDSTFITPPKLVLVIADKEKGLLAMPDFYEGANYFGGDYNKEKNEYRFNIARYVQQVLNGTRKNEGIHLISNLRHTTANRVQLAGGDKTLASRMRLRIVYTPLD